MGERGSGGRRPRGPKPGTLVTAMVVGQARKGVLLEVAGSEILLARSRWGAAADLLADAMYGQAVTVEVVAGAPGQPVSLTRVGIERSLRQPRLIEGRFRLTDGGVFEPADGTAPFAARILDQLDASPFDARAGVWSVGAPLLGVRLVEPAATGLA